MKMLQIVSDRMITFWWQQMHKTTARMFQLLINVQSSQ